MITNKTKEILSRFGNICLEIGFENNVWKIGLGNKPISAKEIELGSLNEDVNVQCDLLLEIMPGYKLTDFDFDYLGFNNLESFSYNFIDNQFLYFHGELLEDGIKIKEVYFDKALDFFIHIFQTHSNCFLNAKELEKCGLISPMNIFVQYLAEKGYHFIGINNQNGSLDNNGYRFVTMILEDNLKQKIRVEFPVGDAFNGEQRLLKLEELNIKNYPPGYLKLLKIVRDDALMEFIENYRIV